MIRGGQGACKEMHNPALIDWIRQVSSKAELVLSVCTGALLLAKVGLLDGLEATTHHGAIEAEKFLIPHNMRVPESSVICSLFEAKGK